MERVISEAWLDEFPLSPGRLQAVKYACERWYNLRKETDSGGWYEFEHSPCFQYEIIGNIVYFRTYAGVGVGEGKELGNAQGERLYRIREEMPSYDEVTESLIPVYSVDELKKMKTTRRLLEDLDI